MSFLSNLSWRYAVKKFGGRKVGGVEIAKIKEAIRFTPSSFGTQPYHVVVIENKYLLTKLRKYTPNNEIKLDTCSHLLVFCARTDIYRRFVGIEKLQHRPKGSLSRTGLVFQYFAPIITTFSLGRILTKKSWSTAQAYIALGFALSACAELEVDSCPMEGFDASGFSKILRLPGHIKPVALLAVGYRDPADTIYPKVRFPESDLFTEIK
jgi:nitroreductase/dihydropteridine reductase